MDKLKKIKPIYIDLSVLLITTICAINILVDTLSYSIMQRLLYSVGTIIISLFLFYIRKNKKKYICTFISLVVIVCLIYLTYLCSIKINLLLQSFNIIDLLNSLDIQCFVLASIVVIYVIISNFVSMVLKKNTFYGLLNILMLLGIQYAYSDTRSTFLMIILMIIVLTYYLLTTLNQDVIHYHLLQFICILIIVISMILPALFIPYSSYVERPLKDLFMTKEAKDYQKKYEEENGYAESLEITESTSSKGSGSGIVDGEGNDNGQGSGDGQGASSTMKESNSGMSGGGAGADADLNSAGDIELDNKTVALRVTSSSGPISTYLRESSAANYNEGKWEMLTTDKCLKIYNQKPSIAYVQNLASYYSKSETTLTIDEISISSPYKFYPYYSYDGDLFKFDSYAKGQSSSTHKNVKLGVSSSALLNETSDDTSKEYDQFVDENYLDISSSMKEQLIQLLNNQGYHEGMSLNEKVSFVKNLLASQCVYTLHPGNCPNNQDPILYFLLENKKGYCMHFASSATLLLRTMNVPARYTTGYVLDEADFKGGNVAPVTQAKAHAWVEVYVKGVGWVMIEVTPGSSGASGSSPMDAPVAGKVEETNQQNIEEQKQSNQSQSSSSKQNNQESKKNDKQENKQESKKEDKKENKKESKKEDKKENKKESKKEDKKENKKESKKEDKKENKKESKKEDKKENKKESKKEDKKENKKDSKKEDKKENKKESKKKDNQENQEDSKKEDKEKKSKEDNKKAKKQTKKETDSKDNDIEVNSSKSDEDQENTSKQMKKQNKQKNNKINSQKANQGQTGIIVILILFVLLGIIGVIVLVIRRKYLLKERYKALSQENMNKRYIAYYDYLNEIVAYNQEIENHFRDIALKAAYSNELITQEELDEIVSYVNQSIELIKENKTAWKLLIYKYIYVLYE